MGRHTSLRFILLLVVTPELSQCFGSNNIHSAGELKQRLQLSQILSHLRSEVRYKRNIAAFSTSLASERSALKSSTIALLVVDSRVLQETLSVLWQTRSSETHPFRDVLVGAGAGS
jgi:hypothetical protein